MMDLNPRIGIRTARYPATTTAGNALVPGALVLLLLLLFALSGVAAAPSPIPEANPRPNVIYINVDDLGYKDVGYMGGTFFETPHIDALASQGMMFTRNYAAASNCAPSRASLMTGQYTPRHGVYTVSPSDRGEAHTRKLVPIANTDSLQPAAFTLAELFKQAGYTTATFGKWHLGQDPTTQGFDRNVGGDGRGAPGKGGYFSPYNIANITNGPTGEYLTDRLTSEAIRFIADHREEPFFVYLPFYAVHTPLMAKDSLVAKYRAKANPLDIDPVYAAMVETMDTNVGRLLTYLRTAGLEEKTIVVFTSDNGGIRSVATQAPLRAGKGSYYDGGIRVPLLVRWPTHIRAGSRSDEPIINLDFFPTFSEILGIAPPGQRLDGVSLLPVWKGGRLKKRPLFWHFPIYLEKYNALEDDARDPLFRTRPGAVVMLDHWKLHHYFEDDAIELYDLRKDIGERNNLAQKRPAKARKLRQLLQAWQQEVQAPIPTTLNPAYRPTSPEKP